MTFPDFSIDNPQSQWERFCKLLWLSSELNIWLDVSRMKINSSDLDIIEVDLRKAIEAIDALESGAISNKDENRQVGHYWLRNITIAPTEEIREEIEEEISLIEKFGKQITKGEIKTPNGKQFTDVLWIGIGGSGLGPRLIIEALQEYKKGLSFHFLDNVDPSGLNEKFNIIKDSLDTTLFVIVSKSGGTPEPRIGMQQARKILEFHGGSWPQQSVAITMNGSELYKVANEEQWLNIFNMQDWVGGRTSITSAVGLLPISLIGLEPRELLKGAKIMDQITRTKDIFNNPAILLSLAWWQSGNGKGTRDMVVLPYRDRLELFSRYLQQLVMESLGKRNDRNGNTVNQGLSVYGNKGSTDQHAYVQQLRDGLDNYFAIFIEVLNDEKNIVPIANENPGDYLSGFLQGTRSALTEAGKQSITITMEKLDSCSLGALIALFERTVSIYAELININAYDQPGVEAGKKAASKILVLKKEILKLLNDKKPRSISQIAMGTESGSNESIYFILRHILSNDDQYAKDGNWGDPNSIIFRKL